MFEVYSANRRQDDSTYIFKKLLQLGYDKGIWHVNEKTHTVYDICDTLDGKVVDLKELISDLEHDAPIFETSHPNCNCYILCYSTTNPELDIITVDWKGESEEGRILDRKDRRERSKDFYRLYDQYKQKYDELENNKYLTGRTSEPEHGIYTFDVTLYENTYNPKQKNDLKDKILDIILDEGKKYNINVEDASLVGDEYMVQIEYPLTAYYFSKTDLMDITWSLEERRKELQDVIFELDNMKDWLNETNDKINNLLINYETEVQEPPKDTYENELKKYKPIEEPKTNQPEKMKSFDDLKKYFDEKELSEQEEQKIESIINEQDLQTYYDSQPVESEPKQVFKSFDELKNWWYNH